MIAIFAIRHLAVHQDRHLLHLLLIARIHLADFDEEPAVNLLYDLVNTRQETREQIDRPFLKSLRHDRMVCVSTGLRRHVPGLFPVQAFLVNKKSHQLGNRNRRMGVIHLDHYFFVQLADIAVFLLVFCDQRLKARGNEEILLLQTEFFS